jgi:hypothetical protein
MPDFLPEAVITSELADICQQYKIAPEEARRLFLQQVQRRPDLLKKLAAVSHETDLTRLRAYKDLIKDVRKHIYYHLRQYQPDKTQTEELRQQLTNAISAKDNETIQQVIQQLLQTHVSTKERAADYPQFYRTLFKLRPAPRRILDIGCGIHPLSYPFTPADIRPDVYFALDSQPDVIDTLAVFAPYVQPSRLIPLHLDIAEADWTALPGTTGEPFDLACLLKLIPVIARQQRSLLPKLAAVPARHILITATTEAMTRNANIRRREDRFLREFIELTGRPIFATFEAGNEFGYLIGHF